MEINLDYSVNRKIEYLEFCSLGDKTYCAYKETVTKDGESSSFEGLALKENIEKVSSFHGIEYLLKYYLYDKKIEKYLLENMFWEDDTQKMIEECCIKNPYSYLLVSKENVDLYNVSHSDYSLYDICETKLPTAVYFEYIQSHMDDKNFDLPIILEILKQRNDIKFVDKVKGECIVYAENPTIKNIPNYNCDEDRHKYLEFVWMPSNEDFSCISDMSRDYDYYNKIYNDIFKLPRLKEDLF